MSLSEEENIIFDFSSEEEYSFLVKYNKREYLIEFHEKYSGTGIDLYERGIEENPVLWKDIYDDSILYESLHLCLQLNKYPRK